MTEPPIHSNNTVTTLNTMPFEIQFHLLYANLKLYYQTTLGSVP